MSRNGNQNYDRGCADGNFTVDAGAGLSFKAHNAFINELANDICHIGRGNMNARISGSGGLDVRMHGDARGAGFDMRMGGFDSRMHNSGSLDARGGLRLDFNTVLPELHAMVEHAVRRHMQFSQAHPYLQSQSRDCWQDRPPQTPQQCWEVRPDRTMPSPYQYRNGQSMSFSESSSYEQHGNQPPQMRYSSRFQTDAPENNYRPANYRPQESPYRPVNYQPQENPFQGDKPYARVDRNSCTAGENIVACANGEVGNKMWQKSPYAAGTENGKLGCAASVSEVLKGAGYSYANSAGVQELSNQLTAKGWTKINVADHPELVRPGDVIYGIDKQPGKSAHVGIVGEVKNGEIWQYDNNSANGKWSHCKLDESALNVKGNNRFGKQMWVLRPPENSGTMTA